MNRKFLIGTAAALFLFVSPAFACCGQGGDSHGDEKKPGCEKAACPKIGCSASQDKKEGCHKGCKNGTQEEGTQCGESKGCGCTEKKGGCQKNLEAEKHSTCGEKVSAGNPDTKPCECGKAEKCGCKGCAHKKKDGEFSVAPGGKCEGDVDCCRWGGECLGSKECCKKLSSKKK